MLRFFALAVIDVRSSCLDDASAAEPSYLVLDDFANNYDSDLVVEQGWCPIAK